MSWQRAALNVWLRWTERPSLSRVQVGRVGRARARFEWATATFLRPPKGVASRWETYGARHVPALHLGQVGPASVVILYFHGGGYFLGSPNTVRNHMSRLVATCHIPAVLPKYRLAPEHRFPAPLEDAEAVYRALLAEGKDVILGGDSAGGGLALALLGRICAQRLPQPVLTFALSPWTDLTLSGASMVENDKTEVVLPPHRMGDAVAEYLGPDHPRDDPEASAIFARFDGASPVYLTASRAEVLRDDTIRMAEVLRAQGVDVTLSLKDGLPHVWQMFAGRLPEADASLTELSIVIRSAIRQAQDAARQSES